MNYQSGSRVTAASQIDNAIITLAKLVSGTSAQMIVCDGSGVPTYVPLTGDVTTTSAGVTSIGAAKVLSSMMGFNTIEEVGTASPSAAASSSVSITSPTTYNKFIVVWALTGNVDRSFYLRINGTSTANYEYFYFENGTYTNTAAADKMLIGSGGSNIQSTGMAILNRVGSGGRNNVSVFSVGVNGTAERLHFGGWFTAGENVTSITILPDAGTQTGEIRIYGLK